MDIYIYMDMYIYIFMDTYIYIYRFVWIYIYIFIWIYIYVYIYMDMYIYIHTYYIYYIYPSPTGIPIQEFSLSLVVPPLSGVGNLDLHLKHPTTGQISGCYSPCSKQLAGHHFGLRTTRTHTHDENHNDAEVDRIWILKDIPVSMRIFRHFHILSTPGWLYVYVCTYRCVYTAEVCIDTHTHIHTDFMYIYIYIDSYISFHFPHYMWQCVDLCIYCIYYNSKIM